MSDDPTEQEQARDGIYARIAELAPNATFDELVKLGDAYSKTAYGAQGGDLRRADSDDYHYTTHEGEQRSRPEPGFRG